MVSFPSLQTGLIAVLLNFVALTTLDGAILTITNTVKQYGQSQILNIAEINIYYYDGSGSVVPLFGAAANSAGQYGTKGITAKSYDDSTVGASSIAIVYMAKSSAIATATTLTAKVNISTTMTLANDK